MSYSISAIEDIDADEARTLRSLGIRTTERLLEAAKNPKGRKLLAARTELVVVTHLPWKQPGVAVEMCALVGPGSTTMPSVRSPPWLRLLNEPVFDRVRCRRRGSPAVRRSERGPS